MFNSLKEIKFKDGTICPIGSNVYWKPDDKEIYRSSAYIVANGEEKKISHIAAAKALDIPIPDHDQIEEWVYDSVCDSIMGETVEPDGIDEHNSPSWLIALGLI